MILSPVQSAHQVRFATAVQNLLNTAGDSPERDGLARTILNLGLFAPYRTKDALSVPWLGDSTAREILKVTLTTYRTRLSSTGTENKLASRIHDIVVNLDTRHADRHYVPGGRVGVNFSPSDFFCIDRMGT
ncbi:hypothetical protein DFH06DRAFT_1469419 [Mycena polygramma]|nr:hypothetical protein DFH06DRAFT_1469419 [Mycena polygramma]